MASASVGRTRGGASGRWVRPTAEADGLVLGGDTVAVARPAGAGTQAAARTRRVSRTIGDRARFGIVIIVTHTTPIR